MTSPKTYLEARLAEREQLVSAIEMFENHLVGKDSKVGLWEDGEDVTERRLADAQAQLAALDAEINRLLHGRSSSADAGIESA